MNIDDIDNDIPRRTIDELEDYADSTSREAHPEVESHGGFECVWRVRCVSDRHAWQNSYLAEPLVLDDNYYNQKGARRIGTLGDAVTFSTQSAAIRAAEQAGWFVDANQALCPECRDEIECLDRWGVDERADAAMGRLTNDLMTTEEEE